MFYATLLRHLYLHKYQFTFLVNETSELPINYIQQLSDSFKKALDDVAKAKNKHYQNIKNTKFQYVYTGMHFPDTLIQQPEKKNINTAKISTTHPCYPYLKKYNILPWWIQPTTSIFKTTFHAGDTFSFNFYICGEFNLIWQTPVWYDVLFKWAANGLGINQMQCSLMQIDEIHPKQNNNTLFIHTSNEVYAPIFPIKITDFEVPDIQEIQLKFLSPTSLSKYYTAFSFNYLTERILKRALSLQALYCNSNICWTEINNIGNFQLFKYLKSDVEKNAILYGAQHITTQDINVSYANKYHLSPNTKNNTKNAFQFYGYVGHVNYINNIEFLNTLKTYVPLLKLAEHIHIGDKIRYGYGWIRCIY